MVKKLFTIVLVLSSFTAYSQVVQWRGPERNGHYPAKNLLKAWPDEGPKMLLKIEGFGKGYSSPIYRNDTIFVTGMIDTLDYLSAYTMKGRQLWLTAYGRSWVRSYPDTRCTPTLEGNRIYVISGTGELVCLNSTDGAIRWKADADKEYQAEWSTFGIAESPLIVNDMVFTTPAGALTGMVAFNKYDGSFTWKTEKLGGRRTYGSPTVYSHNGVKQIIALTDNYVFAVKPGNGNIAWKFPFFLDNERVERRGAFLTNTPLIHENQVFVTSGYDVPSVMLEIAEDGNSAEMRFVDTVFDNHHHGVVYVDGYIYGTNWQNNKRGNVVCMDWKTGKIKYEHFWEGKSSVIFADGLLYLYEEGSGNVGLVRPNPEKFDLVSSFKINEGAGPHWAHPAIFNQMLFIRHGEVLMIFDVRNR